MILRKMASFLSVATLLLNGCTMIPEYTRPQAPVPAEWPSGAAYKDIPSSPDTPVGADLHWRNFFVGKRLPKIIEMALANNRDLRVAALNIEKARALYRIQRYELLPTVDANANAIKQRVLTEGSGSSHVTTIEQYTVNLGVTSWEIDFFGRIRSLEQSALEEYFATEHARRSAQTLLISEVANTYLTLAADRENLQLAKSTLEAQQASYNLIQRRFEVGLAPKLDLRQVQQRVDAARVDVARFTGLAAQDENALNLLVGSPVPAELLPEELSSVTPLPDISPGLPSDVLLRRPDILQAESLLKASNANIGAARAALFPNISLTTAMGSASTDLSNLFKSGTDVWNYAARVSMPIFDPRAWSALKVTKVQREIAVSEYERTIQGAFRDVADALAVKGTVGNQRLAQESLVEATDETYRLSFARYDKGTDTYLSVLDAQRSLYSAQQGLINIRLSEAGNAVRLYAALGGGAD